LSDTPVTVLESADVSARVLTIVAAEIGTGRRLGRRRRPGQSKQFGRPIGSFQAIKHLLTDRFVQLDAAWLLVEWAANALDTGQPDADCTARAAVVAACNAANTAAGDALQPTAVSASPGSTCPMCSSSTPERAGCYSAPRLGSSTS
jgi:alkylation response protein AidB-like acyl-CoA dehydrogenase